MRERYQPLQPTVQPGKPEVLYHEQKPDSRLQGLIFCYWELKTSRPLHTAFHYQVVADGCMDIFFEADNPSGNFLMGFTTSSTEFPVGMDFHYLGIRFLPGVFPQLFRIDAFELTDRFEHLDNVVPVISRYISRSFYGPPSLSETKSAFDDYFLSFIGKKELIPDHRINRALDVILENRGNLTLKNDLDIGISKRQLRRLFHTYIGGSVKMFSKIVRFQNALKTSLETRKTFPLTDTGYYDQAHFIKEFKTFYGSTPGRVFRN